MTYPGVTTVRQIGVTVRVERPMSVAELFGSIYSIDQVEVRDHPAPTPPRGPGPTTADEEYRPGDFAQLKCGAAQKTRRCLRANRENPDLRGRSAVPLSRAECGRLGAEKANAARTPEQRREYGRRASLGASVAAVVNRAPELTPEQLTRLRQLFAPALTGGGQS